VKIGFMKKLTTVLFLFISVGLSAQSLKEISLEDAIMGPYKFLAPERLGYFAWIPETDNFLMAGKDAESNTLFKAEAPLFGNKRLITLSEINQAIKNDDDDTLSSLYAIKPIGENTAFLTTQTKAYLYNFETKKAEKVMDLDPSGKNQTYAPNNKLVAYTIENNLYLNGNSTGERITSEANKEIVFGQAVHRYEFGIMNGIFWSPNSNLIAFYRNDQTMVTDYPIVDVSKRPAAVNLVKYPMAGMKSEEVTIGVYHVESKTTVYLKTGEPKEQYLTNVAWGPNEEFIYVAVLNRDQNHVKLNRYNIADGSFDKTLFEEKEKNYVQPLHPIVFNPKKDNQFVWQSEKEGFNHLYLYNTDGELINQLTTGEELITDLTSFDSKGKKILVQATSENGLSRTVKWVDLKGKGSIVSNTKGTHTAKASPSGKYFLRRTTSYSVVSLYEVCDYSGKVIKTLLNAEDPLKEYQAGSIEMVQFDNGKGALLNARIIKPHKFKKSKQYPVLVYVYNGPGVQLLQNRYMAGASHWMLHFANKGYIVFTVDGRGSENRGKEFEQITFRNLGEIEIEDQLAGLEYLKKQVFVDTNRFAVHGWSYGGFMTTGLMLKTPGKFKVGVSGGGVQDWKYYEVMYTERFMDTPESNPEGYAASSNLDKVENLEGKLLIIHDTGDDTVVPQHSEDLLKHAVDNGIQLDYFVYPGHPHNVRGKDRIHLMKKVLDYIEANL
jgi:dipeptidyl-peptidase 4